MTPRIAGLATDTTTTLTGSTERAANLAGVVGRVRALTAGETRFSRLALARNARGPGGCEATSLASPREPRVSPGLFSCTMGRQPNPAEPG